MLSETSGFAYARIEGVEDLDLIKRSGHQWLEQYIQIKSRIESRRGWTIAAVEQERVFTRFFRLFRQFQSSINDKSRTVEFVLAVEGELSKELQHLQEGRKAEKCALFAILMSDYMPPLSKRCLKDAQRFFESQALRWYPTAKPDWSSLPPSTHQAMGLSEDHARLSLERTAVEIAGSIDDFLATMRFESRLPAPPNRGSRLLEEASIARLTTALDVSPNEAQTAVRRLLASIKAESQRPSASLVDRDLLLRWLGLKQRPALQRKPTIVDDYIDRNELSSEIVSLLKSNRVVALHGISKIGKSQFASRLINLLGNEESYFWFTFSGTEQDTERLIRDLAIWIGRRSGVWQLADDSEAARLHRDQFFARAGGVKIADGILVIDDAHKSSDTSLLTAIRTLLSSWPTVTAIFLSEQNLTRNIVPQAGVPDRPVGGLSPREALTFFQRKEIDTTAAVLELTMLCLQFGGHPLMLRVVAQELSKRPTQAEVQRLAGQLPSIGEAKVFIDNLSNKVFFDLLRTNEQRALLSRLSLITSSFDWRVANAVASVSPKITVSKSDWTYMTSVVLDEAGADRYMIPQLLRRVAEDNVGAEPSKKSVLVAAARTQVSLHPGTRSVDFFDFQAGIFSFIFAEEYVQAAQLVALAVPSLYRKISFALVRTLFVILNGSPVQKKLKNDSLSWQLLFAELMFRANEPKAAREPEVVELLRELRKLAPRLPNRPVCPRASIATMIVSIRFKRLDTNAPGAKKSFRKIMGANQLAIRAALKCGFLDQVSVLLAFYKRSAKLGLRGGDLETVKDAVVALHEAGQLKISENHLAEIYAQFAVNVHEGRESKAQLLRQASEYDAIGCWAGYFAAMYGLALVEHEKNALYGVAREIGENLLGGKYDYPSTLRDRILVLRADAYWAEKKCAESAVLYEAALLGHHVPGIRQHIRERLVDALAADRRYEQAIRGILGYIRRREAKSGISQARLYARLAYFFTELKQFTKAAIACWGLVRLATREEMDEIHYLSLLISGYVLGHIDFCDPAILRPDVLIRDSSAISDRIDPADIQTWKSEDKLRIKSTLHISGIFELTGSLRRSLALLKRACAQVEADGKSSRYYFALTIRKIRLEIRLGMLPEAITDFLTVLEYEIGKPVPADTAMWVLWDFIEPATAQLSDSAFSDFARRLYLACVRWPGVQIAVLLRQARGLFDRFLVQAAKERFRQAEGFANSSNSWSMLHLLYHEKFFVRPTQFYSSWNNWFSGIADALVRLSPDSAAAAREEFAKALKRFVENNLPILNATFNKYEEYADEHPFEVAIASVLDMSDQWRLHESLIKSLREIQEHAGFKVHDSRKPSVGPPVA